MISNFLNSNLLQQYLNRNFAQPTDTGMPVYNTFDLTKGGITNIPININQQPFNDYYGPTNIDTSFGVANEEDVEEDVEGARRTGGLADLFRAALSFAIPGFSFLENIGGQPYQQFSPGTTIRNGIVNVAGVNTPYSMFGGDFYNPNTGLNRFDRAAQRFTKTGSMLDLFGSSRTGKEFFEKRRQIQAQKQKDLEEAAKAKIKFKQDTGGGGAGFGGSRRGDADISDSQRGGFATDDTAGFF